MAVSTAPHGRPPTDQPSRVRGAWMAAVTCALLGAGLWAATPPPGPAGQPNASYLAALAARPARPAVHYQLDLTHPGSHLADVTLIAPATGAVTTVQMPMWYPGRYSIYHFEANVQQASAACVEGGAPLAFTRSTPHSWVVETQGCTAIQWHYRVYGNEPLNGSFFQLDNAHANLNGGPVYMYVEGEKPNPVTLSIQAPAGWQVLNELGQLDQTQLWFPNYDIFIDAPTEAAPRFTLDRFQTDGKTYRVLIHDFVTANHNRKNRTLLLDGLRRIAHAENQIIGPDELDTYTFFFHFDRQNSDGMEHLFGTQIMIPAGLATPQGLFGAEADAAHEFFHQWNVKRIRPVALGPWNYEAENPTPSLWVAEGFTQYYGDITLERVGLQSKADYLRMLGDSLGRSLQAPGTHLMSPEDASTTAWFHDATPLLQDTNRMITTPSYYLQGERLAAVLDLDLRRNSRGKKSLNDVMRWLWEHTYHAPRASYYLPGRGYTDTDVEHAIEAVAGGASYADFFKQYARGASPPPYDRYLAAAGYRLMCRIPAGVRSFSGVLVDGNTVRGVVPGSPGEAADFGRDQVIDRVNGQSLPGEGLNALPPDQPASVQVTEHGVTTTLSLTPVAPHPTDCSIKDLPTVTATERALRDAWLAP